MFAKLTIMLRNHHFDHLFSRNTSDGRLSMMTMMIVSLYIVCSLLFHCYEINGITVGLIKNMSLTIPNTLFTIIFGTCNECLCYAFFDGRFSSFNCHIENRTCELFLSPNQTQLVIPIGSSSTDFYFFSLTSYITEAWQISSNRK